MKTLFDYFPNCLNGKLGEQYRVLEIPERVNTQSKFVVSCLVCSKEIVAAPKKIFQGQKPCACGKNYYKTHERKVERLLEVLDGTNILVVDTNIKIKSSHSRVNLSCGNCGNNWSPTYDSLVSAGRRCPRCAGQYRYSDEEYIERINYIGQQNKFKFLSKLDDSKLRIHSKARLECCVCLEHWDSDLGNILTGKYSCPNCARRGFNPVKRSILYLLKVTQNDVVIAYKYGITNVLSRRLENMRAASPDKQISVAATWGYFDGKICRQHENILKSKFNSFLSKDELKDGYTETVSPDSAMDVFMTMNELYNNISGGPTN